MNQRMGILSFIGLEMGFSMLAFIEIADPIGIRLLAEP